MDHSLVDPGVFHGLFICVFRHLRPTQTNGIILGLPSSFFWVGGECLPFGTCIESGQIKTDCITPKPSNVVIQARLFGGHFYFCHWKTGSRFHSPSQKQGCRFVPYTFSETKPQMVPMDLNIGFQGFDSGAKSTTLQKGRELAELPMGPFLPNKKSSPQVRCGFYGVLFGLKMDHQIVFCVSLSLPIC